LPLIVSHSGPSLRQNRCKLSIIVATCVGMKGSADKVARLGWIGETRKHAVCVVTLHIRRDWQHEVDSAHAPSRCMQRRPCL